MIEELLPPPVVAVETFVDPPDAMLFPAEEALIARAVEKRRREFTSARLCARAALARIGVPPAPILPGERGAPTWPEGVVGSMTHCAGYRAAAVALAAEVATIGLDAEPNEPLPEGVLNTVANPGERAALADLPAGAGVSWDRLLFSVKESVYKAWFPLCRTWLDFTEAEVTIEPSGAFTARLLVPGPVVAGVKLTGFTGRWLARDGLLVTAIAVLADGRPAGGPR
jgi:enterobactin synthetase component D / holo-[acyl-carrier protein] synthase